MAHTNYIDNKTWTWGISDK